jgi:hypothetical protein
MKATPEDIPEGSQVHPLSHGHHIGSGVIDMWMPDGSAFGFGSIREQANAWYMRATPWKS